MEYHPLNSQFGIPDYQVNEIQLTNMLIGCEGKSRCLVVVRDCKMNAQVLDYCHAFSMQWPDANHEFVSMSELIELKKNNDVYISNEEHSDLQSEILQIFKQAKEKRASDIHLVIEKDVSKILFRVDRKVRFYNELIANKGRRVIQSLYTTMCEGRTQSTFSFTLPLDARIKESHVEQIGLVGGRLATRPTKNLDGSLFVSIRLFDKREGGLTLSDMGMTNKQQIEMSKVIASPRGIVFLTGPTNSGKSTLAQCLIETEYKLDNGLNILTVEDPIEREIIGANQTPLVCHNRGVPGELSKAWGDAISNLMRLDPDRLFIGEVRDPTSADGAISAGHTGHKVYTTMHTSLPIDVLTRLRSFKVEEDMLTDASLICAMIGQRLTPLVCKKCSLSFEDNKSNIDNAYIELIEKYCDVSKVRFANPTGCSCCDFTGYKGMRGVYEVIHVNAEFMSLYRERGRQHAYDYWYVNGGETLCENAIKLINSGVADPIDIHTTVCELNQDEQIFTNEIRKAKRDCLC